MAWLHVPLKKIGKILSMFSMDRFFKMIDDYFIPKILNVVESISVPWFTHSDGNMLPIMDIWLKLR
jgi:hypothetical protein